MKGSYYDIPAHERDLMESDYIIVIRRKDGTKKFGTTDDINKLKLVHIKGSLYQAPF